MAKFRKTLSIAAMAMVLTTAPPAIASPSRVDPERANTLFAEERWAEAAVALQPVARGSVPNVADVAEYRLAIALYRLGFHQASATVFGSIAERPTHAKHPETLLWLARLSVQLPDALELVERIELYGQDGLASIDHGRASALRHEILYRLGKYRYDAGRSVEALHVLERVDASSPRRAEARLLMGIAEIELRRPAPALRDFAEALRALRHTADRTDRTHLGDLVYLSIARTLYSTSFRIDAHREITIDPPRLAAAIASWSHVSPEGARWPEALYEQAWALFMAGDPGRALGNLHTLDAPAVAEGRFPEADLLRAFVAARTCQSEAAMSMAVAAATRQLALQRALLTLLARHEGADRDRDLVTLVRDVRAAEARGVPPAVRAVLERELGDRELGRSLGQITSIEREQERFDRAPSFFRSSRAGDELEDALSLALDLAMRRTASLARERLRRAADGLLDPIRRATDLATAVRRGLTPTRVSLPRIEADGEHVLWPFDGEYWRDELGTYSAAVTSRCAQTQSFR